MHMFPSKAASVGRRSALTVFALGFVAALLMLTPARADDAVTLQPADPQPRASALVPGLAVKYAYPSDVKTLHQAESWRGYGPKVGAPLSGLSHPETAPGERVLTADSSENVVAFIDGFMYFAAPGKYGFEFKSNDGLRVEMGGAQIYEHDGRHPCVSKGRQTLNIPSAGWYPLSAVYFQGRQTACLELMVEAPDGSAAAPAPDRFAHLPE